MSGMSPEEVAVDEAIRTAVQTQSPGSLVIGWTLVVASAVDDRDATAFSYVVSEGQNIAMTLGLLHMATMHHEGRIGDAREGE